jgi:adenylate kinase family enzyme
MSKNQGSASLASGHARIVVVGVSGSGKTTLACQLAEMLDIPHIELDALHWGPDWTEAPLPVLQERVRAAIQAPAWVLDGNYSKVRDIVWPRATHLVWLDYSFPVVLWRILARTARRVVTQEELWSGNRESLGKALGRDSIILWVFRTYRRQRRDYPRLFAEQRFAHLTVIHHTSPSETWRWVTTICRKAQTA